MLTISHGQVFLTGAGFHGVVDNYSDSHSCVEHRKRTRKNTTLQRVPTHL